MRFVLIIIFLCAFHLECYSQNLDIPVAKESEQLKAKDWEFSISLGAALNISRHDLEEELIAGINSVSPRHGFVLGVNFNYLLTDNLSLHTGLQYQPKSSYWHFDQFASPELSYSYLDWWDNGYGLGVPILLSLQPKKASNLNLKAGGILGMNKVTTKKIRFANSSLDLARDLVSVGLSNEEILLTSFMFGVTGGIAWQPWLKRKFSLELLYQYELTKFSDFNLFFSEENTDIDVLSNYSTKGSTRFSSLILKVNYSLFRRK